MALFLKRHNKKITDVLSCWDRVVITGTIPGICFAQGMTSYLYAKGIRIFDYAKWAEPLRNEIRENAERLAKEAGIEIEFIRKNNFRKEQRVRQILLERGDLPGLVHVFSAMETWSSYKPWHDKKTHRTYVKPDQVSMFLGRKLHGNYEDELGNRFSTRIEGTCIKHYMGKVAIKMYDKHGIVLRVETTSNDVSFFKHHRKVEHRDGTVSRKLASLRKTIYSLVDLRDLLFAANRRYLDFIAAVDDPTNALRDLDKLSRRVRKNGRSFRGFNLFSGPDLDVFRAIVEGGTNITGFRNRDLQQSLSMTGRQITPILKRLREHGLIKKIGGTFKYYLTAFGRRATATGLKLREMAVIPLLPGNLMTTV